MAASGVAVLAIALSLLAPMRELSGDTVPARIGGAVLRCSGSFDLARVDWVKVQTDRDRIYYWIEPDMADEYTSVYGPAPAIVASIALLDFGDGDTIADATLRSRERGMATVLLALAAALFVIAVAARTTPRRAAIAGAVAVASFAGAASLGQGMWQATVALPALTGALATLAWRDRMPRLRYITPALLALAVMLRPTIAPVVLGLGLAWTVGMRDRRTWLVAAGLALAAVAPLAIWNVIHLETPLPVAQFHANQRVDPAVFSAGNALVALAALVVSPGRGLVWFAPVAIIGVVIAFRGGPRAVRFVAAGIVLQLVVIATFRAWHGGQAYGPRFLAEACWIAIWLVAPVDGRPRIVTAIAVAVTVVVGQLGLWRFQPEQWEVRRRPEIHQAAFWDFADSPIAATFTQPTIPVAHDAEPRTTWTCRDGRLLTR